MCLEVVNQSVNESDSAVASLQSRLRVGVAGLGVIGEGAALDILRRDEDYEFAGALVRSAAKDRGAGFDKENLYDDIDTFLEAKPDIVIDALPCGDAGRSLINTALTRGVSVVSANKQAVAGSLAEFHDLAKAQGAAFRYSASVGGGAPMVETVRRAALAGSVKSIDAILNGTVNFILSAMKDGEAFEAAVKQAQQAGFAEPDPTADLSGEDAKAKSSILCFEAFGRELAPNAIALEALTPALAQKILREGGVWKQLATITKDAQDTLQATVSFRRVDDDPLFCGTLGEGNALRVTNTDGAVLECKGKGAGQRPTVDSLLTDLGEIRRFHSIADDFR